MIEGVRLKPLKVFCDDRGYLMEVLRADDPFFRGFGQTVYTVAYPGTIKAFHWHRKQDDLWFVASGMAQIVLFDLREDSPTYRQTDVLYFGDHNRGLLVIPTGVAHGYRVLGTEPVWPALPHHRGLQPRRPGRGADPLQRSQHRLRLDHPDEVAISYPHRMLRFIILGLLLIVIVFLIWVAWGELQAFRAARERDRHDQVGG